MKMAGPLGKREGLFPHLFVPRLPQHLCCRAIRSTALAKVPNDTITSPCPPTIIPWIPQEILFLFLSSAKSGPVSPLASLTTRNAHTLCLSISTSH